MFFETKILFSNGDDVKCFLDNERSIVLDVGEIYELDAELKYYNEHILNIFKGKASVETYENIIDKMIFEEIDRRRYDDSHFIGRLDAITSSDFQAFDDKYYAFAGDLETSRLPHFYLEVGCTDIDLFEKLFKNLTQCGGFNCEYFISYFPLFIEEIKYLFCEQYNIDKNFSLGLGYSDGILPLTQKVILGLMC